MLQTRPSSIFQVQLYEEPEKPEDALQYLKNKFTCRDALIMEKEMLAKELELLKKKVRERGKTTQSKIPQCCPTDSS